jgi:UDP-galactopyranose mutase
MQTDVLIVGAGFSGLVMAERICCELGKRCLIVDKRPHIGGNAYDYYDEHGVLIHKYGPHYFRTNSEKILSYLSQFTQWAEANYEVKAFTQGRYWSFPINLQTFEEFVGRPSSTEEMEAWLQSQRVEIQNPSNSEEVILSKAGHAFYEQFFKGYTLKQWQKHPRELDASVCARIPIRTNRDGRYLREKFQALPSAGYTKLFEKMIHKCGDKLGLLLNTDYRSILQGLKHQHLVYTGMVDAYFDYKLGRLPYRSLRFEHEHFNADALKSRESVTGKPGHWQPCLQVNYPDISVPYTRTVELKHVTAQQCVNTTIVREFPKNFEPEDEPYYPIPTDASASLYKRYRELALAEKGVSFIGRLATYRYYNMDQVVGMALAEFDRLRNRL